MVGGRNRPARPAPAWALVLLILLAAGSPPARALYDFPDHLLLMEGDSRTLRLPLPLVLAPRGGDPGILDINGAPLGASPLEAGPPDGLELTPTGLGRLTLDVKLFGVVPFRRVAVDVLPRVQVFPGGQSIGIIVYTNGVLVVGYSAVPAAGGPRPSPGREAGVATGDVIVAVDGVPVRSEAQLAQLVDAGGREGRPVELELRRRGQPLRVLVRPHYSRAERRYILGLWVRDNTLGVGTLSFYEPRSRRYGALGHMIAEADSSVPVDLAGGRVVMATVDRIESGRRGRPGEKLGSFHEERDILGAIDTNADFGIFGTLEEPPANRWFPGPVAIRLQQDVRPGPAEIYTVVRGRQVERFRIEIVEVYPQPAPAQKGMVIRVTDPRLLESTGGIVQGMSGSPIVQDGRLVGAVTHVFVNDPARGYAVFIEWMVLQSGLLGRLGEAAGVPAEVNPERAAAAGG